MAQNEMDNDMSLHMHLIINFFEMAQNSNNSILIRGKIDLNFEPYQHRAKKVSHFGKKHIIEVKIIKAIFTFDFYLEK